MTGAIDRKYTIIAAKAVDGTPVPSVEAVLFRIGDNAFPDTLKFYIGKCEEIGADESFIGELTNLLDRINVWRSNNIGRCKIPD